MKIKIPKPYWIIGTLVTAGIVTVGIHNFIVANTQEKNMIETSNIQEVQNQTKDNYQEQINELIQRLNENEQKITELQEKVSVLETENSNKTEEISSLQNKLQKNSVTTKTVTVNNADLEKITQKLNKTTATVNNADLEEVKQKLNTTTEKVEKVESNVTNREEELSKKKKRLKEIETRLNEIHKKYVNPSYEKYRIEVEICKLIEKEQSEEIVNEINNLKIQLENIKKIIEEESNLMKEMRKLKQEMLEM